MKSQNGKGGNGKRLCGKPQLVPGSLPFDNVLGPPTQKAEIHLHMWAWHTQKSTTFYVDGGGGAVEVKGEGRWHRKITNFTCRCTQKTQELQIINVTL